MSGSADEAKSAADQAAEQMREATERLRDQAWMFAPLTSSNLMPADAVQVETESE